MVALEAAEKLKESGNGGEYYGSRQYGKKGQFYTLTCLAGHAAHETHGIQDIELRF